MVSMLDLKNALFEGGVVGAGGAGFPTHAKLSDQADTVILNCAECEPLIKVDRQLMVDYINEILSGMQMMVEAMGAKEGIIAVKILHSLNRSSKEQYWKLQESPSSHFTGHLSGRRRGGSDL